MSKTNSILPHRVHIDDAVLSAARKEVDREAGRPYLVGAYLMGSQVLQGMTRYGPADIDIVGVVSGDTALPEGTRVHHSRYGTKYSIPGFQDVRVIDCKSSFPVLEWALVPRADLDNTTHLLGSHACFAASSALRSGGILLDKSGWLAQVAARLEHDFWLPSHVCQRMEFARRICIQKLHEYQDDRRAGRLGIRTIWDGVGFGLMGMGTLVLSAAGIAPTFRYHLLRTRECLQRMGKPMLYEPILQRWGLDKLSREVALEYVTESKRLYAEAAERSARQSTLINRHKVRYYCSALDTHVSLGFWREAVALAIFLVSQCAKVLTDERSNRDMTRSWQVLRKCGWTDDGMPGSIEAALDTLHRDLVSLNLRRPLCSQPARDNKGSLPHNRLKYPNARVGRWP